MHIDFSNLFIYIGDKPYLQCEEAKYIGDVDGGGGGGGVPRSHVEFNNCQYINCTSMLLIDQQE